MFISLEGIDGSGKSTQSAMLARALRARGHDVVQTREPGGTEGADAIRALVLQGDPDRWSAETELLLYNAARRDHVERLIRPSLAAGKLVICDRFANSTRVYQGLSSRELRQAQDLIHAHLIGIEPDLTVLIDMDPETALSRGLARKTSEDRFERKGLEFQNRMRAGFLALAREFPSRFVLCNGDRSADELAADILGRVSERLSAA